MLLSQNHIALRTLILSPLTKLFTVSQEPLAIHPPVVTLLPATVDVADQHTCPDGQSTSTMVSGTPGIPLNPLLQALPAEHKKCS